MAVITLEELFKSSPRREIQSSKTKKIVKNTPVLERLAKNGDVTSRITENGTTKMKILVKKQDLKQVLEAMNVVTTNQCTKTPPQKSLSSSSLSSIERRLYGLMKRRRASQLQQQQACKGPHLSSWRPALQSIPEESYQ
ncbi:hypothetical protein RND81_14G208300 [Saponaria officinalis]|uniref:Uncharacterized protein n=1 Tax=Saponaria officinalis TaxID=3572 RepID=A0AAW1GS70_SAPOF